MERSILANLNEVAVSANLAETALNTEQTLDTALLVSISDILGLDPRRENNANELTGKEEADTLYNLGNLSAGPFTFEKAQAQHFGLGYSSALGNSTPSAAGTGYKHAIIPATGMDLPALTAAQKYSEVFKRRLASLFIDQLTATFAKDSWAKLALALKGTGKYTDNIYKEEVTAAYNATELTLDANGVHGSTAALRLANVHQIRVLKPGTTDTYENVIFSAVSDATPAVITISAPGVAATSTTFEIIYVPTEAAWCTFPARVTETPLRVTDLVVTMGGKWNGLSFLGGKTWAEEIESIQHNLNNNMAVEFRVGGTGSYANYAKRQGRVQTLKVDRQFRDFILQQKLIDNEYFGAYMKATGAVYDDGSPSYNYAVEVIFPRCAVLSAPISVNGKMLAEAGDLQVLEDDTYGSVLVNVWNEVAGYAQ